MSDLPGTGLRSGFELPERLLGAQLQDTVCSPLPIPLGSQYPGPSLSPTKVDVCSEWPLEKLFLLCFPKERCDREWLYSRSEGRLRSSQDKFGSSRVFEGSSIHSR